jgi:uncharacterized OsmC-like protein
MNSNRPYLDPTALATTVAAVRESPSLGQVTFRLNGKSSGGLRLVSQTGALTQAAVTDRSRSSKFSLQSDEPMALLGSDTAVSPGEYVLQALAGCYTVTLVANAAARGIELTSLDLELECDFDLNGFLGINPDVRSGAQEIRARVSLESPAASREDLQALVSITEQRSPIRDTLANPVKITTVLA